MNNTNYLNILKESSQKLINCKNDFFLMKQAVDNLYEIFKSITDIDINNLNEGDILLPTGKAISPSAAAHCLLEMKRTAIFLRGIKKAIDQKLNNYNRTIKILYAGCGPYATLITPLLTLYNSDEIRITLLDINQTSLKSVKKLINTLNFENFIDDYILEDASNYKITKDYNIVISETMQACLQNEPQVSIMQNLIPQLNENTIFIPQQITIDAYLKNPGKWDDIKQLRTGIESKILKALFSVNKTNLDTNHFKEIVQIPENLNGFIELMLHTTIIVFKDEILGINDCSLNSPRKFYEFKERYANSIEFWYSLDPQPSIECRVLDFA
jgi:hypothetical protein